jgi:hypothetical protein
MILQPRIEMTAAAWSAGEIHRLQARHRDGARCFPAGRRRVFAARG